MAQLGLQGAVSAPKVRTTRADPNATPAPDLVQRRFSAAELDELWIGDLTYIPTGEGWLYLATVIDVCSRPSIRPLLPIGWSGHLEAALEPPTSACRGAGWSQVHTLRRLSRAINLMLALLRDQVVGAVVPHQLASYAQIPVVEPRRLSSRGRGQDLASI